MASIQELNICHKRTTTQTPSVEIRRTSARCRAYNPRMKLRQKFLFLAIAPLILALCAIAIAVRYQATTLARQQRDTIQ